MREDLTAEVRSRAKCRCEYCLLPEAATLAPFQIDHIIARKHDGATLTDNLAYSCFACNAHKGPNIATVALPSLDLIPLFNPRKDDWIAHFKLQADGTMLGLTAIGWGTIRVLSMNDEDFADRRYVMIAEGLMHY